MGKAWGTAAWTGDNKNVIKLDPRESELRQQAAYLAKLGNMGMLEQRMAFAKWQAQESEAQYEKAKLIEANPSLVAQHVPPARRWPMYLLIILIAAMVALQGVVFYRTQHPPSPLPESAPKAEERPNVAQHQKGRGAR